MKIVAITACPIGIAHTYMAADAMETICKSLGIEIKVEMQGSLGQENILTEKEIREADVIIFANAKSIVDEKRFDAYREKIIQISPKKIMHKPELVIEALKENGYLD